jgi:serine palmitoyltransferase
MNPKAEPSHTMATLTKDASTDSRKAKESPSAERTRPHPEEIDIPLFTLLTTYISYAILIAIGHVRDFFGKRFRRETYSYLMEADVSIRQYR